MDFAGQPSKLPYVKEAQPNNSYASFPLFDLVVNCLLRGRQLSPGDVAALFDHLPDLCWCEVQEI